MKTFFKKLFSNSGEVSFGRVASGVMLGIGIIWGSYIVITKGEMPELAGLSALVAGLYGLNKISEGFGGKG